LLFFKTIEMKAIFMLPVIKIGDSVNRCLEKYAVGSDTLSNVSEKLIERCESHQNNSNRSDSELNTTNQALRNSSTLVKKCRNPEKKTKRFYREKFKLGTFQIISKTVLEFHDSSKKVWCKYSSYSSDLDIYFKDNYLTSGWRQRDEMLSDLGIFDFKKGF